MIDKSGQWWKGENAEDLAEFVVAFSSLNYRADEVGRSICARCHATVFGARVDDDQGCAQRVCRACGLAAFIGDSEEWWADATPGDAACPCGAEDFEVAVGFSLIEGGELRWITVGARCVSCGAMGVYVDWKIDYEPSRHLLALT